MEGRFRVVEYTSLLEASIMADITMQMPRIRSGAQCSRMDYPETGAGACDMIFVFGKLP